MPTITAIMIDSREPDSVKNLKFGGIPTTVTMLETGDIYAVTDDGHTLVIERKTQDDFLNTLKDERLFPQLARMVEKRNAQIAAGEPVTEWAYLVIEEPFTADRSGKVITSRGVTGWSWASLQGTLLSIQELGVMVVYANGALDYQDCILRIGRRNRDAQMRVMPAKVPNVLGPAEVFLTSLPGIGIERAHEVLEWADHNVAHALIGLTDMEIKSPVGLAMRRKLRDVIGLEDGYNLELTYTPKGE